MSSVAAQHQVSEAGRRLVSENASWVSGGNEVASLLVGLKECSQVRDLERGRNLHGEAVERGIFAGKHVQSSLINMYAKCGSMAEARMVFDSLQRRSVVSWNCLIQGYVDNGEGELALQLFDCMKERDARSYVAALTACAALAAKEGQKHCSKWLEKGKAVHSSAVKDQCCDNIFVESTLIYMYSKAGSMTDARSVFNSMAEKNVVTWNALLQGYVENGYSDLALELFEGMETKAQQGRGGGVLPNARTYVAALTACAALAATKQDRQSRRAKALEKGMDLHARAVKNRCCDNAFVQNTLVDMYGKCGRMVEAKSVFDQMVVRSAVSWTALLQGYVDNGQSELALELFESMEVCCVPNARTYVAALTACVSLADAQDGKKERWFEKAKAFHARCSCCDNKFVANTLVDLYGRFGDMVLAREVFEGMQSRDIVTWNALLQGYVDNGEGVLALEMFGELRSGGCVPDARTYVAALTACAALAADSTKDASSTREARKKWLEEGKAVHLEVVRSFWCCDVFVGTALVNMYSKCGKMVDAKVVFDEMIEVSLVSWNCLIQGFVDNGDNELCLQTIAAMDEAEVGRNGGTFIAAIMACGVLMCVEKGKRFHEEIRKAGLEKDVLVATCLIDFYAKCGCMDDAQQVFDRILVKDLWAWNTLMGGFSQRGDVVHVFEVFERFLKERLSPNEVTFTHLLTACAHAGLTSKGKECFAEMQTRYGVAPNIIHYNCMIDLFGRANRLDEALRMMKEMPFQPNVVSWSSVLGACRKWNNLGVGKVAYESVLGLDEKDTSGYLLMANMLGDASCMESQSIQEFLNLCQC